MKIFPSLLFQQDLKSSSPQKMNKPVLLPSFFLAGFIFCCIFCFNDLAKAQPTLSFQPIIQNLSSPVAVTNAGDGSGRLFIVEAGGLIKIYKNGSVLAKPFLDLSALPPQTLTVIAFHPKYKKNRLFYVFSCTVLGTITLSVYNTSKENPDSAIANSGKVLFSRTSPSQNVTHSEGDMHFGKDGYLYISVGDGDRERGVNNQSQNGQLFFGKILRLNVNESNPPYYSIPPDNPFVNDPNVLDEIWAMGLRNAWRWSFDRKTGDMWIGDVGQDMFEEINFRTASQSAGANYGWRCYEGNADFNTTGCAAKSSYVFPVFTYGHNDTTGNSVIGGFVYRGTVFPKLKGYYICVDYDSGEAWKIKSNGLGGWISTKQPNVPKNIVGFGEGEDAELYAVSYDSILYHVGTTGPIAPLNENIPIANTIAGKDFKSHEHLLP
ncbi:MAG TPA: PQQ-dependent sugar dehydrogenase, partial [Panacibacter sp.]|nr:PQQ-dependent sugar dehydrogenase [Panacibacter sp.]